MPETPANDGKIETLLTDEVIARIKALSPEMKKQVSTASMVGDVRFVLQALGVTTFTRPAKSQKLGNSAAPVYLLRPSDTRNHQLADQTDVRSTYPNTGLIVAETRALIVSKNLIEA